MHSQHPIRDNFLAGFFAIVPVVVTIILIRWIDERTRVLAEPLGLQWPLIGVVIALTAIFLLGMAVRSVLGKQLLRMVDGTLLRLPLIRPIYSAWKQVSLPSGGQGMFARVVLVPAGQNGMSMLGFTSGKPVPQRPDFCPVFLPNSPNPITGRLMFVKQSDLVFLNITVEEALKVIISTGNYLPEMVPVDAEAAAPLRGG